MSEYAVYVELERYITQLITLARATTISSKLNFNPEWLHSKLVDMFKFHLVPGYNELRIPVTHEECMFKSRNREKPDIWPVESKSLHAENNYLLDFINPFRDPPPPPTPKESVFEFAEFLKTTDRQHHLVMDSNFLSALVLLTLYDLGFECTISCKTTRPSFIWKKGLAFRIRRRGYTGVASSQRLCCACTHKVPGLSDELGVVCYWLMNWLCFIFKMLLNDHMVQNTTE